MLPTGRPAAVRLRLAGVAVLALRGQPGHPRDRRDRGRPAAAGQAVVGRRRGCSRGRRCATPGAGDRAPVARCGLVGGAIFEFATGILNVQLYYPWHFNFVVAHYYGAWVFLARARASTSRSSCRPCVARLPRARRARAAARRPRRTVPSRTSPAASRRRRRRRRPSAAAACSRSSAARPRGAAGGDRRAVGRRPAAAPRAARAARPGRRRRAQRLPGQQDRRRAPAITPAMTGARLAAGDRAAGDATASSRRAQLLAHGAARARPADRLRRGLVDDAALERRARCATSPRWRARRRGAVLRRVAAAARRACAAPRSATASSPTSARCSRCASTAPTCRSTTATRRGSSCRRCPACTARSGSASLTWVAS